MRIARFHAAFILLTLITILLLVYSVQFLLAAPVQVQIGAWVRQMAQSFANGNADQAPLPTHSNSSDFPPKPEQTPSPTPTPLPTQTVDPRTFGPTQTPVYQVIEDPIPDGSLVIPSLSIDLPIVPVPVKDQIWDLESLGPNIGWLQTTGTHPKDDLAMVLVGHVTLPPPGGRGPFLDLGSLLPGSEIIYRSGAKTYTYKVLSHTLAQPDQVEYLYKPDGSRLLLVTCTGYNPIEWQYDLRLVVEAELVSEVEILAPQ